MQSPALNRECCTELGESKETRHGQAYERGGQARAMLTIVQSGIASADLANSLKPCGLATLVERRAGRSSGFFLVFSVSILVFLISIFFFVLLIRLQYAASHLFDRITSI